MFRPLATMIAALGLAFPAVAADRAPSPSVAGERLAGFNDRPLTYVLIIALIAAIVIATADDSDSGDNPASP